MPKTQSDKTRSGRKSAINVDKQGVSVEGDVSGSINTGTQIETQGGAAFLRNVSARTLIGRDQIIQNIYKAQPIAWPKRSERQYLDSQHESFAGILKSRSNRQNKTGPWDSGFVHPLLSQRTVVIGAVGHHEDRTSTKTGIWSQLVSSYPRSGVLVGDVHDGKSLLLRWIVADLAGRATARKDGDLPVYLSINQYPFTDQNGLLDTAAFVCGQQPETMRNLWASGERRILLAIDDADHIAPEQQASFLASLKSLADSRNGKHSIILACRPDNGVNSLLQKAASSFLLGSDFSEWVILPLDDERIKMLLKHYAAADWLKDLISSDERLRKLMGRPGTLADFVRATRGLSLVEPPQNMAQLYQLFIEGHLFGSVEQGQKDGADKRIPYNYRRVKQQLLSYLAFRILASQQQTGLAVDDALCRDIAARLQSLAADFARTRRYMPDDWNATDALRELFQAPVVNGDAARSDQFEFDSQIYRDYYAATYLHDAGERWQEICETVKKSGIEGWVDALILLSGMPATDTANKVLNSILADDPGLAADLWLEKGSVGFTKVPDCVERDFQRKRVYVPENLDYPLHPAIDYFGGIVRDVHPRVALQTVNGLMQLGIDAIDPLLDAVVGNHELAAASAVHALFQMGHSLVGGVGKVKPLINVSSGRFILQSGGTCNATIGDLTFVDVPRPFYADITATVNALNFDPFEAPCSFEVWHLPPAWFAIDYFRRAGRVDWTGLAAACGSIARCAGLVVGKALARRSLESIIEEMTQCAIKYDRLGRSIAADLSIEWNALGVTQSSQAAEIGADAQQVYDELRLLFNRSNRSHILNRREIMLTKSTTVPAVDIEVLYSQPDEVVDLPDLTQVGFAQEAKLVLSGETLRGMRIGRIDPSAFVAAEVVSLAGSVMVENCAGGAIEGITIGSVPNWSGIRAKLDLVINTYGGGQVVGIRATPPAESITKVEFDNSRSFTSQ